MITCDYAIYMQFSGTASAWTDITSDVIFPIEGEYGMGGVNVVDRIAQTGSLTFALDNSANNSAGLIGYYSPGHANCRSGFRVGIPTKIVFTYDGRNYCKFKGRVPPDGIIVSPFETGERKTYVTVRDWMEQASVHEITLPTLLQDKTTDESIQAVIDNMPIPPENIEYGNMSNTSSYVFDTTSSRTKAMTEITKIVMSEFGYAYIAHDENNEEKLVIEGRNDRSESVVKDSVISPTEISGKLLTEGGDYLLTEDGDYILLNETLSLSLGEYIRPDASVVHAPEIATEVKATAHPRKVDADATTVLFSLEKPIKIDAGETLTGLRGRYRDPAGAATYVSGMDMVTPAGTTHYLANTDSAGTATDITDMLTVTATYGASDVSYTITNSGTVDGYITFLQAVGRGIYNYDPVTYVATDATSKAEFGSYVISIDMKYQDDPTVANALVNILLARKKDPATAFEEVSFVANRNLSLMGAFLESDIGTRIRLTETVSGIDEDYFIQGVRFKVYPGGIIEYAWKVKRASEDIYQFWLLEVAGRSELGVTTYLGYEE